MNAIKIASAHCAERDRKGFWNVVAQTKRGERFILTGYAVNDEMRADKMAHRVSAKGVIDLRYWVETYPEYGSDAYMDEAEQAHEAAEMIRAGHAHEDQWAGTRIGTLL